MPDRRRNTTQKVRIDGQPFYACFGEYEDGRLGEVFIDAHKTGSFTRGILGALGRVISVALQCGTPMEEVAMALKDLNFPPHGEASGSSVGQVSSIADWIGKEIEAWSSKP